MRNAYHITVTASQGFAVKAPHDPVYSPSVTVRAKVVGDANTLITHLTLISYVYTSLPILVKNLDATVVSGSLTFRISDNSYIPLLRDPDVILERAIQVQTGLVCANDIDYIPGLDIFDPGTKHVGLWPPQHRT